MEIERIAPRQRRMPAALRLQMVEEFRCSGLTRAAFARRSGIPLATLDWWLTKAKRSSNVPTPVVFSEIRAAPPIVAPTNIWAMEIVRPDGLTIRCREAFCTNDVARLLRGPRC